MKVEVKGYMGVCPTLWPIQCMQVPSALVTVSPEEDSTSKRVAAAEDHSVRNHNQVKIAHFSRMIDNHPNGVTKTDFESGKTQNLTRCQDYNHVNESTKIKHSHANTITIGP